MKIGAWKFLYRIFGILFFVPSILMAAELRQVHVSWDYSSVDSLAGFRLYHGGVNVCETDNPSSREMDCEVLLEVGPTSFSLTAYDNVTPVHESAHSASIMVTVTNLVLPGDIDDSGSVDLNDLHLAQAILVGQTITQPIFIEADVNGDGEIGMAEVQYILQKISASR